MTQEEIEKMFTAHTTFIGSIQRLSLYPKVINIDRTRHELYSGKTTSRIHSRMGAIIKIGKRQIAEV
jgi:hypothetical protein